MKRHPYLAVLLIGWGVPLILMIIYVTIAFTRLGGPPPRPPELGYALGYTLGAGLIPILAGWIALVVKRAAEPDVRLRSGMRVVVAALVIVLGMLALAFFSK